MFRRNILWVENGIGIFMRPVGMLCVIKVVIGIILRGKPKEKLNDLILLEYPVKEFGGIFFLSNKILKCYLVEKTINDQLDHLP